MTDLSRVRVSGPLEPFAAGFAGELVRQGYASQPAAQQLRLMAHLSRWLVAERKEAAALSAAAVEAFGVSRRAAGYSNHLTDMSLRPLLVYLRGWEPCLRRRCSCPTDRSRWRWRATGDISSSSGG